MRLCSESADQPGNLQQKNFLNYPLHRLLPSVIIQSVAKHGRLAQLGEHSLDV